MGDPVPSDAIPLEARRPFPIGREAGGPGSPLPSEHPLVAVCWEDARFDHDVPVVEIAEALGSSYLVWTSGFLVGESAGADGRLAIAAEVLPDADGFRAVTYVPRAMVREVLWLRLPASEPDLR